MYNQIVYGLSTSDKPYQRYKELFYIGCTEHRLNFRLSGHKANNNFTPVGMHVKKLLSQGGVVYIFGIQEFKNMKKASDKEIELIIKYSKKLLNVRYNPIHSRKF